MIVSMSQSKAKSIYPMCGYKRAEMAIAELALNFNITKLSADPIFEVLPESPSQFNTFEYPDIAKTSSSELMPLIWPAVSRVIKPWKHDMHAQAIVQMTHS